MTWMRMDTAPTDGTNILIWDEYARSMEVGYFYCGKWLYGEYGKEIGDPTLWCWLPDEPGAEYFVDWKD